MKNICLIIILQTAVFAGFAQSHVLLGDQRPEPGNFIKDKQEYQGYTIRLNSAIPIAGSTGSQGFDILKDNKPIVHQFQNPLPFSPKGIQNKEDAYKIAQWMIREYKETGHWQNIMPPHIANELNIETH